MTGFGTTLGTGTFVVGKSGTFSWCAASFLDNGDIFTSTGQGMAESSGRHKWRTQFGVQGADGRTFGCEGEVDLAARTWNGKFVERG